MSNTNPEGQTGNPPAGQAPNPPANPPTNNDAQTAATQAVQQTNFDPNKMTPAQLWEAINSLPDKVVDAIREATGSGANNTAQNQSQQNSGQTDDKSKAGVFGGKSFGEWWFG